MTELKPCPFCGGYAHLDKRYNYFRATAVYCEGCDTVFTLDDCTASEEDVVNAWNRRTKIETNIYDKEETYPNCTVQVLTNTVTGDVSVGWWGNGGKEE